jgi:hypothetical protein
LDRYGKGILEYQGFVQAVPVSHCVSGIVQNLQRLYIRLRYDLQRPVNMIACLASPCQHTIVVGMRFSCTKFSLPSCDQRFKSNQVEIVHRRGNQEKWF